MAALTCSACQLPKKGLRRFDKEAKFKNTPDIDSLNMSEQNTCPPQRIMVMPWQNTAMVPIRWRYLSIVLLWFDTFGTHKFNLRWNVAAAGWPFNHPRIHNRPSLPIRKRCWLSNTSILSCGTQLKVSCCWRTFQTWQDVLALWQGLQKSYINSASCPGTQKSLTQSCC